MSVDTPLRDLVGDWSGSNALWFAPGTPAIESASTARVATAAGSRYLVVDYTWAYEDKPHDGHLVIRLAEDRTAVEAVWVDSFHQGGSFMLLAGVETGVSRVELLGSYKAPPGPDWGWRITLAGTDAKQCVLHMFNITPEGEEAEAVRMNWRRP
jgi:hypothetical protein